MACSVCIAGGPPARGKGGPPARGGGPPARGGGKGGPPARGGAKGGPPARGGPAPAGKGGGGAPAAASPLDSTSLIHWIGGKEDHYSKENSLAKVKLLQCIANIAGK